MSAEQDEKSQSVQRHALGMVQRQKRDLILFNDMISTFKKNS